VATTISVAAMVLSLSFINGFQKVISDKIYSFWGHVRVQQIEPFRVSMAEERPIFRNDSAEGLIRQHPGVRHLQTFATRSAILKTTETLEGVLFKGVGPEYAFASIESFRLRGRWPKPADSSYVSEIMLSEHLARQLRRDTGQQVMVYFIQPGEEKPRTRKLTICGIYRTGIDVYDRTYVIGDIGLIRRLNNWDNRMIGGYELLLQDPEQALPISDDIYASLPAGWTSKTMEEIYPEIFDWLNLQDANKYILLTVMAIVAMINLITCLLIMVLERTRMIGLLKAVGAEEGLIRKLFLIQGSFISLTGVIAGLVIGLGISLIQLKTGFIKLDEEAYYMRTAPVEIIWWQVGLVCLGTFLLSLLLLLLPALISKRINVVKAIQFR
jgi:lipoprotein-releasing system permease protein